MPLNQPNTQLKNKRNSFHNNQYSFENNYNYEINSHVIFKKNSNVQNNPESSSDIEKNQGY